MYELDEKDHKIIEILKQDSRMSIRDIAKKTWIRPSTVHQRITQLRKKGAIEKFTLKLNNEAIGENFIVFMLVNTTKDLDIKTVHNNHIKELFGVTGEYDLIIKLKFKDVREFNDFVIDFRKKEGVKETLTMVATIGLKEEI